MIGTKIIFENEHVGSDVVQSRIPRVLMRALDLGIGRVM